jgi:hypothetical protein
MRPNIPILVRDQGVAGSNPVSPTNTGPRVQDFSHRLAAFSFCDSGVLGHRWDMALGFRADDAHWRPLKHAASRAESRGRNQVVLGSPESARSHRGSFGADSFRGTLYLQASLRFACGERNTVSGADSGTPRTKWNRSQRFQLSTAGRETGLNYRHPRGGGLRPGCPAGSMRWSRRAPCRRALRRSRSAPQTSTSRPGRDDPTESASRRSRRFPS